MPPKQVSFTDTHCHLGLLGSDDAVSLVLERALKQNVVTAITVGDRLESSQNAVRLAQRFDQVYAAVGIHPHEAKTADESTVSTLSELISADKVVAIGEIGLDYHYDHSPRDVQRRVFARQLDLALDSGLPVIIHNRESSADALDIVLSKRPPSGVFHCFSGDVELARELLALGFYISFAGTITFKNAGSLAEVARFVPLDRLLLETDSPYLAPVPYRGKPNEPGFLPLIAEKIAGLKKTSVEEISRFTQQNAASLFSLPSKV